MVELAEFECPECREQHRLCIPVPAHRSAVYRFTCPMTAGEVRFKPGELSLVVVYKHPPDAIKCEECSE